MIQQPSLMFVTPAIHERIIDHISLHGVSRRMTKNMDHILFQNFHVHHSLFGGSSGIIPSLNVPRSFKYL